MSLVDCPNVKCRSTSSLWFSYVTALLFSSGFLAPGTTCLAHCKLQCFCVGLSSACTRRRSNLTGTAVACFLDILIPPVLDVQNGKLIAPLLLLSIQSTCRLLPTSELSGILVLPCLWDKQGCFGNQPWITWPAPDQEHWAGETSSKLFQTKALTDR